MSPVILDCSVAISWLMPDEFYDSCFLDRVVAEGALVPSVWPLEIGNTLLMAERQKRLSAEQRHQAVFTLSELPINVDPMTSHHTWQETMELAERYKLTLYDATYLELALRRSLPLATLDKSLKNAADKAGVMAGLPY